MSKELENRQFYQDMVETLNDNEMYLEARTVNDLLDIVFTPPTDKVDFTNEDLIIIRGALCFAKEKCIYDRKVMTNRVIEKIDIFIKER